MKAIVRSLVFGLGLMTVNFSPFQLDWHNPESNGITSSLVANVWARPALNVKKFGAKGDGVRNDSAAISAAFAAARSGDVISFFFLRIALCALTPIFGLPYFTRNSIAA